MGINEKMLIDLAGQVGFSGSNPDAMRKVNDIASKYEGKSEDALLNEILKLKEGMKSDRGQYEKQLKMIKSLRPMMNGEQREKLDSLLKMLED